MRHLILNYRAIQDKAQADVKKRAAEKQATEKKTAAFQDYKKQQTEKVLNLMKF